MGSLGVEVIGLNAYSDRIAPAGQRRATPPRPTGSWIAAGADLGVEARPGGRAGAPDRRRGEPISGSQLLLLLVALAARRGLGGRDRGPGHGDRRRRRLAAGSRLRIRRAPAKRAALTWIPAIDGVLFARTTTAASPEVARCPPTMRSPPSRCCSSCGCPSCSPLRPGRRSAARPPRARRRALPVAGQGSGHAHPDDAAKGYETDNLDGPKRRPRRGLGEPDARSRSSRFHVYAEGRSRADVPGAVRALPHAPAELVLAQEASSRRLSRCW